MKMKSKSLFVSGVALLTMALAGPSVSHAAKRIVFGMMWRVPVQDIACLPFRKM